MKLIDLSMTLELGVIDDFKKTTGSDSSIKYHKHEETHGIMAKLLKADNKEVVPNGFAAELYTSDTHATTHLDAPWHYGPKMNNGEPTMTIEEIPLEWCYGDGVVVDFSDRPDGYTVTAKDFEEAFQKMNYTLKPFDIVLVHTSAPRNFGKPEYAESGCGMGREATLWLTEKGVRVCGTDGMGWDPPFSYMAKYLNETGDTSEAWGGHYAGLERAYCHMERLVNLDKLPPFGFKVCCFPTKIKKASAGWVRAVAMLGV